MTTLQIMAGVVLVGVVLALVVAVVALVLAGPFLALWGTLVLVRSHVRLQRLTGRHYRRRK